MLLFAPDILAEARALSVPVLGMTAALGAALWIFGWRGHRFWIVLITTVAAGTIGMASGQVHGMQPVVAGLLIAVAAGLLALSLARLAAFIAGGLATWLVVQALVPTCHEPVVCFLAGGLAGVLLFKIWVMVLTSGAGSVLLVYAGLSLADRLGKLDAVALSDKRAMLLVWCCAGLTFVGVIGQLVLDRRWTRAMKERKEKAEVRKLAEDLHRKAKIARRFWWPWYKKNDIRWVR